MKRGCQCRVRLQRLIGGQIDVVWNRQSWRCSSCQESTRSTVESRLIASAVHLQCPGFTPAFGREKIQFCHADRRPNTRVSSVSVTPKRRLASMPVKASGDLLARSSRAIRISSARRARWRNGHKTEFQRITCRQFFPIARHARSLQGLARGRSAHRCVPIDRCADTSRSSAQTMRLPYLSLPVAWSAASASSNTCRETRFASINANIGAMKRRGARGCARACRSSPAQTMRAVRQARFKCKHAIGSPRSSNSQVRYRSDWYAASGSRRRARAPSPAATSRIRPRGSRSMLSGAAHSAVNVNVARRVARSITASTHS